MNEKIKATDDQFVLNTYRRYPIEIESGLGCIVKDSDEKEYLDFTSGIGVVGLGHCFKPWMEAVIGQVGKIEHMSNLFYTTPMVDVAKKLCNKSKMKQVFFANSGAEANEGAIKIARKYGHDLYQGHRSEIMTLKNSFHGRTITTLTATGQDTFHQNFGPFPDGFTYVEANNIDDLNAHLSPHTVAIMIEIVQGEGGVISLDKDYLKQIQKICNDNDILLIIDEVQTGMGRCGSLFAYMQYDLTPDIVTCAKGLGNGLPIGGVLVSEKCQEVLKYGDHGSTFGGNPIACAGANVVLDYMNDELYSHVHQMRALVEQLLINTDYVKSVTGLGLMIGIELDESIKANDVVLECMKEGVLFLTAKDKLRLLPPLIVNESEVKKAITVLKNALTKLGEKQ